MAPMLEQVNLFGALNFNFPLAQRPTGGAAFWPFFPANTTVMGTRVGVFLCPSDAAPAPSGDSGPVNYVFSAGDGGGGGDATEANGVFILGHAVSLAEIQDGSSATVACSEQVLGIAGPYTQTTTLPIPGPTPRVFARVAAGPLTDEECARSPAGWLFNKGAAWWDGNYLNTLYNHHATPNAARADCVVYHNPGWKAARSFHPGGVNSLYCDGHVAFVRTTVELGVWQALATRAGGEVVGGDAY
jgi:prepilin-type processing-associated H-X9-DG protein